MKKTAAALLLLCAAVSSAPAAKYVPGVAIATSRTGQFIVYEAARESADVFPLAGETNLVELDPAALAVSCERIKQALLGVLSSPDDWRGKIRLVLRPFRATDRQILVTSERFADGWNYRLELPAAVEPARLVSAVTQLLLLEMANRKGSIDSAQLPLWLAEAMPDYLRDNNDVELVVQANRTGHGKVFGTHTDMRTLQPASLLKQAHDQLHGGAPLSVTELLNPPPGLEDIYRASALLFLHELLQLRDGGQSLYAALPELAWDTDWRLALVHGFHSHFKREVDLEKWWALQTVYVTGKNTLHTWSRPETLKKLAEILRCPLQVQVRSNEPVFHTETSLQAIIKGWNYSRQRPLIREKITLLAALRLRADSELAGLASDYGQTLENYLREVEGSPADATVTKKFTQGREAVTVRKMIKSGIPGENDAQVKTVVMQLNALDARRSAWQARPAEEPVR